MLRISLTIGAFALFLAVPAFAQGSPPNRTTGSANDTSGMTCNQIMERVRVMSIVGPGATMDLKQKEMIAARAAQAQNDEAGCKLHARKALQFVTYQP